MDEKVEDMLMKGFVEIETKDLLTSTISMWMDITRFKRCPIT